jgi:hypothetical protein
MNIDHLTGKYIDLQIKNKKNKLKIKENDNANDNDFEIIQKSEIEYIDKKIIDTFHIVNIEN